MHINQKMQKQDNNWMPLESNPEVMNPYIEKLGLRTDLFCFQEVLSTEEWALAMIPQPVLGILMLYQCTPAQIQYNNEQCNHLNPSIVPQQLFYMKQYAHNACGTIGLFHIIINAMRKYPEIVVADSYLRKFCEKVKNSPAEDKGKAFEQFQEVKTEHKGASQQGQSAVQTQCDSHFIAFVQFDGILWQLDGQKKCPVNHGQCSSDEVLTKGNIQIQKFMQRDPQNVNFCFVVLAPKP